MVCDAGGGPTRPTSSEHARRRPIVHHIERHAHRLPPDDGLVPRADLRAGAVEPHITPVAANPKGEGRGPRAKDCTLKPL